MVGQKEGKKDKGKIFVSGIENETAPDITKAEDILVGKRRYKVLDAGHGVSYVWSTGEMFLVDGHRMPDQGVSFRALAGGYFVSQPFMVFYHELLPGQTGNRREPTRTCQCQGSEQVMRPVDCDHIKAVKTLGKDEPHQTERRSYPMTYPCLRIILAEL